MLQILNGRCPFDELVFGKCGLHETESERHTTGRVETCRDSDLRIISELHQTFINTNILTIG